MSSHTECFPLTSLLEAPNKHMHLVDIFVDIDTGSWLALKQRGRVSSHAFARKKDNPAFSYTTMRLVLTIDRRVMTVEDMRKIVPEIQGTLCAVRFRHIG